ERAVLVEADLADATPPRPRQAAVAAGEAAHGSPLGALDQLAFPHARVQHLGERGGATVGSVVRQEGGDAAVRHGWTSPGIYAGPALPQGPRRELIEQQRGGDVPGRQVPHLRRREHDVGRVRRVIETDQVPDLMKRDDPDVVRRKRAAGGVARSERAAPGRWGRTYRPGPAARGGRGTGRPAKRSYRACRAPARRRCPLARRPCWSSRPERRAAAGVWRA